MDKQIGLLVTHKQVADLQLGDLVDLQDDPHADNGKHPEFEFQYQEVTAIDHETDECIAVYFENFGCGFPPDHKVFVKVSP